MKLQGQVSDETTEENLILDENLLELKGSNKVALSRTEMLLLKQLATAPNRKVDYFQLLERTKREVDARSKASLEVQIVNLRKKISAAGHTQISIRAIRNEGYELLCNIKIV